MMCYGGQKTRCITMAVFGVHDMGRMSTETETPLGPSVEYSREHTGPFRGTCVAEDSRRLLPETSKEPLLALLREPWPPPLGAGSGELLVEASLLGPRRGGPGSEPGAGPELLKETLQEQLTGPLKEAWPHLVREVLEEPSVPSAEVWTGVNLVSRILDECLEMEKNCKRSLRPHEEEALVRLAHVAILEELSSRKKTAISDLSFPDLSFPNLSISDFECCSWRWLKLALLMREYQDKEDGGFSKLIVELEDYVSRPTGLSDTWFLAGVLQKFLATWCLAGWLIHTTYPQGGWSCRKMIFRISFPDGVVRLPESEECVNRVCASSKLGWWLHQAQRNIRVDEKTWKVSKWPTTLFGIQRSLGKRIFNDTMEAMKRVIPPSACLSNQQYLACLLKYVRTSPRKQIKIIRCPKATPRSSSSMSLSPKTILPEAVTSCSTATASCSPPSLVDADRRPDAERSVAGHMATFVAGVLEECAERERSEGVVLPEAEKVHIAKSSAEGFEIALSFTKMLENGRRRRKTRFNACGWRWLCVAGLMNDYLDRERLHELIADSEKIVPRPKHVSPLWYLACQMQQARIRIPWQQAAPSWWAFSCAIYPDHFPHEFGELPMSETSARLIVFSSRAAHWLASGIINFRVTRKTWLPSKNADIVDVFHTVFGNTKFNEIINLIKPKVVEISQDPEQVRQQTNKSLMETVLKYTPLQRRTSSGFCRAWGFDVSLDPKRPPYEVTNSSEDEPPTKKERCCTP
ncbi:hypothetical protein GNI_012880 [Gregarina niphandrodes]|uniref:Uncharacterized protein n=1 Tax=Gregarina niphandrodes TaxID=110365 RepID=A0A023BCL7_GRENI|nr:hypothetical protein GNI_012880 [Gregarina niphandrodes]EZG84452.1 hypothetical protein GNI_012880 [Gregarina niphandrodes]|eukprot:XP_011128867.1 hypothetical protein GNI_012880 [Gregarina niphandrodes]